MDVNAAPAPARSPEDTLRQTLLSRGYLRLLLLCVLLGVPIALAAFLFVGFQHELQHWVWESLPEAAGYDRAPWWWPLPALLLAGLILAPIVTRMPGRGGHLPVNGLGGPPLGPDALPGVVLAALATLPLGVVLGPEAPLMAVGSGLALLAVRAVRERDDGGGGGGGAAGEGGPRPGGTGTGAGTAGSGAGTGAGAGTAGSGAGAGGGAGGGGGVGGGGGGSRSAVVLATAGSTAAISTILGGPIVAALMVVEAAGIAGPQLVVLLLPALLASATGALVFTGFGQWTGLSIGGLRLPEVPPDVNPDAGDFLWGVPLAALVAVVVSLVHGLGRATATWTGRHTARRTVACAVGVGGCLTAYALLTGRSPENAALSGQVALGDLAAHPHAESVATLLALVVCKGLAWGLCLGALRGGPIFPAVLLGAALGVACSGLPGLGTTPALALGVAAATVTVTGLPVTSSVLAVLLMGKDAADQMPLIVVSAVVAYIVAQLVRHLRVRRSPAWVAAARAERQRNRIH
ncbi:chloride channel protein [Streptomyces griseosporeus]|uniref:chloride channel protein n=1 Tax=Streptomyces griseosporeus TaxID=1910 RepID=UPI003796627B